MAGQLQGMADRGAAGFIDADVDAGHALGRAGDGGEAALVAEELHHGAVVDQRQTVGVAVLDLVGRDHRRAMAAAVVGQGTGQGQGVVRASVRAVVEHDAPAGQRSAGRAGNLDALADIGAGVVVMQLVDEDGAVSQGGAGGQAGQAGKQERAPAENLRHGRKTPEREKVRAW